MAEREIKIKIARIIMQMDRPFSINGLIYVCEQKGITDVDLILEVLADLCLCDAGVVSYSEITNDCWGYISHV